jgi:hypothetical protein
VLEHTKFSTRVEFFENILNTENIHHKRALPLNRQTNSATNPLNILSSKICLKYKLKLSSPRKKF